jgi:hypothetical protein
VIAISEKEFKKSKFNSQSPIAKRKSPEKEIYIRMNY